MVFSPKETMIENAVLPDEVYEGSDHGNVMIEGKEVREDVEKSNGRALGKKEEEAPTIL